LIWLQQQARCLTFREACFGILTVAGKLPGRLLDGMLLANVMLQWRLGHYSAEERFVNSYAMVQAQASSNTY
jgi:hypothetical protein